MIVHNPKLMSSTIKVGLLSPYTFATGNTATISRLFHHLKATKIWQVSPIMCTETIQSLTNKLDSVDLILALHAYKSGRFLLNQKTPFIIVLGGTDVSHDLFHKTHRPIVLRVLRQAAAVICFTWNLAQTVYQQLNDLPCPFYIVPQAVPYILISSASNVMPKLLARCGRIYQEHLTRKQKVHIFLLVASIRQVKDPSYLISAFQRWHSQNPQIQLMIVGPILDTKLFVDMNNLIQQTAGVSFLSAVSKAHLWRLMQRSVLVLNTSHSEGMCSALLEAMALGVPVLARNNMANRELLMKYQTGFLFDDERTAVLQAQKILSDTLLTGLLSQRPERPEQMDQIKTSQFFQTIYRAQQQLNFEHHPQLESCRYHQIINVLLGKAHSPINI